MPKLITALVYSAETKKGLRAPFVHQRTAQAIEASYGDRLEDHYDDLAHHYRLSDNAAKAIEYLRLAGEQAMNRGAYAPAVAAIDPALKIDPTTSGSDAARLRSELGLRVLLGRS